MLTTIGRTSRLRASAALVLTVAIVQPETALAQRARGSVHSANRNPSGNGGSWSNSRSRGSTSRTTSGNTSSRTTTAQGRGGTTATGTRNVTKSGDEVQVNRNVQSSTGASKSSQKTYEMDDGRVE